MLPDPLGRHDPADALLLPWTHVHSDDVKHGCSLRLPVSDPTVRRKGLWWDVKLPMRSYLQFTLGPTPAPPHPAPPRPRPLPHLDPYAGLRPGPALPPPRYGSRSVPNPPTHPAPALVRQDPAPVPTPAPACHNPRPGPTLSRDPAKGSWTSDWSDTAPGIWGATNTST